MSILILAILSFYGSDIVFAEGAEPTVVPVACDKALSSYAKGSKNLQSISECAKLFGPCTCSDDKSGTECSDFLKNNKNRGITSLHGMGELAIDLLIERVVGTHLSSLYFGYNGIPPSSGVSDPNWLRGTDILNLTTPYGACAHVGACNQFCGEGTPPSKLSFNIKSVLPVKEPLPQPSLGGNGLLPYEKIPKYPIELYFAAYDGKFYGGGTNLFRGLSGDYVSSTLKVRNSDFWARGVIVDPKSTQAAEGLVPAASTGIDADGWPLQTIVAQVGTPGGCNKSRPADQNRMGRHSLFSCHAKDLTRNRHYVLDNITWDDGSIPGPGNHNCDIKYSADYSTASTMAALQTGILVQAIWMKLDEVVKELRANNAYMLNISPENEQMAALYRKGLLDSSTALFRDAKACSVSYSNLQENCALGNSVQGYQQACQDVASVELIRQSNFTSLAALEVMIRAEKLFSSIVDSTLGQAWISQLKSYSVASCLHGHGGIGELFRSRGVREQNMDTCKNCGHADQFDICANTPGGNVVDHNISEFWAGARIGNCFPYAYTTALYAYAKEMGMKVVDIQNGYQSLTKVGDKPLVSISGCQADILDKTFSPLTLKKIMGSSVP